MKSVLISIRPKWCELIASGAKKVEVRKTRPKLETPFKAYIYCTGGPPYLNRHNGYCYLEERDVLGYRGQGLYQRLSRRVIGEFVCADITKILNFGSCFLAEGRSKCELNTIARYSCLDFTDMRSYFGTTKEGYAWHISDHVIYEQPKELKSFRSYDVKAYTGENGYPMPTHKITRAPQSWCYVESL